MRVLIVTPMYPPDQAGIALQSALLAQGLIAAGQSAAVLAYSPRDTDAAGEPQAGEEVVWLDRRLRTRKLSPSLLWRLRSMAGQADVVHVHGHTNLNVHAWLARRGRPVLVTYHGTEVWHYDPAKGGAVFRHLTRRAHVVCVSQPLADALFEKTGFDSAVVEPAVGDAYVEAARSGASPPKHDPPVVLSVKGLYPVNNGAHLLEAMAQVCAEMPRAELWLAGEGPLRDALETQASELAIADNVKFLGLMDNAALVDTYAQATVFVNAATLESYGNVTVEALACGTPAVVCETAGATALVRELPQDIRLVPQGDVAALAGELLAALSTPRTVRVETRQRIAETKSAAAMAQRYLELYVAARS